MSEPVVVFRTPSGTEASVVEALLDAHGIDSSRSSHVLRGLLPRSLDGHDEVLLAVRADEAERASAVIASYRDDRGADTPAGPPLEALEAALGYRFRDRGLLEHALTHRSRANEDVTGGVTDNESLEFLGDAVLGFVVADLLFHHYPERDEGQKSKMKAGLVSAAALGERAVRLDVGAHLLLGRGEEKSGGRRKQTLLSDTYEALIAAIYLDGGLEAARAFITREFEALIDVAAASAMPGDDYKSALQEHLQASGRPLPEYVVADEVGPAHQRRFHIDLMVAGEALARGEGRTKKEAEQEAARVALAALAPSEP